jgi:hypothetical protein
MADSGYWRPGTLLLWSLFFSGLVGVVFGLFTLSGSDLPYNWGGRLLKSNLAGFGALIPARLFFERSRSMDVRPRALIMLLLIATGTTCGVLLGHAVAFLTASPVLKVGDNILASVGGSVGLGMLLGALVSRLWLFEETNRATLPGAPTSEPARTPAPTEETRPDFIQFFENRRPMSLSRDRISHLEARGKRCVIHAEGREHVASETLAALSGRLPGNGFIRVHKSFVVNVDHVLSLESSRTGAGLVLKGDEDERLPVGRAYLTEVRDRFRSA